MKVCVWDFVYVSEGDCVCVSGGWIVCLCEPGPWDSARTQGSYQKLHYSKNFFFSICFRDSLHYQSFPVSEWKEDKAVRLEVKYE